MVPLLPLRLRWICRIRQTLRHANESLMALVAFFPYSCPHPLEPRALVRKRCPKPLMKTNHGIIFYFITRGEAYRSMACFDMCAFVSFSLQIRLHYGCPDRNLSHGPSCVLGMSGQNLSNVVKYCHS